jgi:hypothetical protein
MSLRSNRFFGIIVDKRSHYCRETTMHHLQKLNDKRSNRKRRNGYEEYINQQEFVTVRLSGSIILLYIYQSLALVGTEVKYSNNGNQLGSQLSELLFVVAQ